MTEGLTLPDPGRPALHAGFVSARKAPGLVIEIVAMNGTAPVVVPVSVAEALYLAEALLDAANRRMAELGRAGDLTALRQDPDI